MNMFMNIIMLLEFYLDKILVQFLSVGLHQDLDLFYQKSDDTSITTNKLTKLIRRCTITQTRE